MKMFFKWLLYDFIFIVGIIILYEFGFISILFEYFCIGFYLGIMVVLFLLEMNKEI